MFMTRTKRIWQKLLHPERLRFYYDELKLYVQDKPSVIKKKRRIRKQYIRIERHRNSILCKKSCKRNSDEVDEYFGRRYTKLAYTEYFD